MLGEVMFAYWGPMACGTKGFLHRASHYSDQKSFDHWLFAESLMTSPERPVFGVENGKPVYQENTPKEELERGEIYKIIGTGIIKFAELFANIYG